MANKNVLEIQLKTTKEDFGRLKEAGAFNGPGGSKNQTKINDLIKLLQTKDVNKLEGPDLTQYINDMKKLRGLLDKAAAGLSNYSESFKKQQEVVAKAESALGIATKRRTEALKKEKEALQKVDLNATKNTYFNKKTGRQVTSIQTIGGLYDSGDLEIRGADGKKSVSAKRYGEVVEKTGIKAYAEAHKEVQTATISVDNAKIDLNTQEQELETIRQSEKTDDILPLGKEIIDRSDQQREELNEIQDEDTKESEKQVNQYTAAVDENIKSVDKQSSSLGRAFKQFTIYATAIRLTKRALREAVSTVKELDKELTEQAMVTGLTREQTYKLVKSYQDLAQQTGATTKEIAGVATEYMKQGKSIQEAMTLTEAAVSAAKVARVSTADSVNYLTTALNGFQLSAQDAMLVSDKFAAVAAASATDYDELAIALSKVASQANLAGMSIDYTTALLTKGLETTREAPETMGTALKTIIARMRELSDYGETLEGDTDINNVETQLGYVGIALRNTAGELRSTEDVLDELGKKWDTLDKNQQAAVAKALAGTRQQSRLIAMMTDYERVTELQEIAQRSAGATAAQAGVYLEGIEAALNKITIAWEKIVTAVTDADWIINLLNTAGNILDNIGEALDNESVAFMTIIPLATIIVAAMTKKYEMQKRHNRAVLQEEKSERNQIILQKENALAQKKEYLASLKKLAKERGITIQKAKQATLDSDKTNDAKAQYILSQEELNAVKEDVALKTEIAKVESELKQDEAEIKDLKLEQLQTDIEIAANGRGILGAAGSLLGLLTPVLTILQLINGATMVFAALKKREPSLYARSTDAAKKETAQKSKSMFAGVVSAFSSLGPWGVPVGIALALALVAALGVGIAAVAGAWNMTDKTEDDAKEINKLSNEIYKLQEKANAINQITTSFDDLDNKIIQTNKDIEEMNSLLEQAGDKLSDEISDDKDIGYGKGVSEKEHYQGLVGNKAKRDFLDQVEAQARIDAKEKRDKQIETFRNNSELLNENTANAEVKKAQTSIYANAVYNLQDYIDKLKETENMSSETASAIEQMTQAMIEEADLDKALDFADHEKQVKDLVDQVKTLELSVRDANEELKDISVAEIITSDDYGIRDKVDAFNKLKEEFGEWSEEYQLLATAYKDYETFSKMGDDVLKMVEYLELSIEDINQLGKSYKTLKSYGLNMSEETFKKSITGAGGVLDTLAKTGGDVEATVKKVFGATLSSADSYEKTYNAIINSLSSVLSRGMLNMGQDVTKLKNTVNGFYEKATEWQSMTDAEQAEFMSDNAHLFEGQDGQQLLAVLESGDLNEMERLLKKSDAMKEDIKQTLKWIDTELSVEEAKVGEARNEAYINQLKKWRSQVEDQTNFFRADLEFLIEQEQAQLNIYKDFLEKQQEQLEEALDKRKQAYEDYFEAINQQQENDDYQEQSDKLVANLSKLSTSTDMASQKQAKELKQQLEELEKERQQTLRERAQEAVMNSIDQEVEDINDKFDKLLDNSQLLLEAMRDEVNSNPQIWTELMASARESGMTNLQLEEFGNELLSAFGSDMTNVDMRDIQETIMNNATINIGDRTYDLNSDDGNAFWNLLQAIMNKNGYN